MTSTLDVDAAVVRETLDGLGDDAVVVAHSWGGSPVTLGASGAPNLKHVIYLAAIMIEAGLPAVVDMRLLPPVERGQDLRRLRGPRSRVRFRDDVSRL